MAPLAACRKPAESCNKLPEVLYVFEYKTEYLLIYAPYTCIVVLWHTSNATALISQSQICYNTLYVLYSNTLGENYCETVNLANVDPDLWQHMVPFVHSVLNIYNLIVILKKVGTKWDFMLQLNVARQVCSENDKFATRICM